ncbi:MAG TPA: ABC transporter permease [Acidimicrobiales bacterium]|nr:ABC transporter permease [Acidimicrobiales bacterium]
MRDTRFLFFLWAMPAAFYMLLARLGHAGSLQGLPRPEALMVAMIAYATMGSALYGIGPPLAQERANHWIRQLRVMPLTGWQWLTAKVAQGALLALPGAVIVAVIAAAGHGVGASPGAWAGLAVLVTVGSVPFSALGLVVGQALDGQASNTATLFLTISLAVIGGLLVPVSLLPGPIHHLAHALPSYQLAATGRAVLDGTGIDAVGIAVLAIWTLAAVVIAWVLWRRHGAAG